MKTPLQQWYGECMRKKKLQEHWADGIIAKAKKEGKTLFKYRCDHCTHWHVTSREKHHKRIVF